MFARIILAVAGVLAVAAGQVFHKHELAEEKTPYDYVKDRLDSMRTDHMSGLPLSNSYQVEESEDYPEQIEGAASNILGNAIGGIGGIGGIGQGLGVGGIGLGGIGLGQGLGVGYTGVGGAGGIGGLGGIGGYSVGGGTGVGGIGLQGGVGLINPAINGLGVGGLGLGGGLLYQPILGSQVGIGSGFVEKKGYDAAQKKAGDENVEKLEKKAEEESKHGQEGFQQGAVVAKAEKGDSSFYKDEEAKKKAAGDEKYYEGDQKLNKQGK